MKNIKYILSSFFIVIACKSFSQPKFRKVIGNNGHDNGMSAQQTIDKGYIAFGSTSSFGSGTSDFYLVKTDSFGIPKWHQMYGGINIEKGTCVRQTADSGYIMAGYTNSYGAGGYDVYLIKTDSLGGVEWTQTYGGSDWDFANCVEPTSDGGYIICGGTYSYGSGDEDYYLIKTNSLGDTLWTKTYGGTEEDEAKSVIQTSDGGYILTGYTKSMGDMNGDFYTVKTDAAGDTLWTHKFGGPLLDYANDVIENTIGGYTVGGETKNFGYGNSDAILIHLYPSGNIAPFNYVVGGPDDETVQSITQRSDGKIAMVGMTYSWGFVNGNGDLSIIIIDTNWMHYESTTFGTIGHEKIGSIENTADNGFIICGSTNGFNNKLDDFYLIKTDSAGYSNVGESVFITDVQPMFINETVLRLAPNPCNMVSYLNIVNNGSEQDIQITMYNILGELLTENEIKKAAGTHVFPITTAELPDGIYLLKVKAGDVIQTAKMIVKH